MDFHGYFNSLHNGSPDFPDWFYRTTLDFLAQFNTASSRHNIVAFASCSKKLGVVNIVVTHVAHINDSFTLCSFLLDNGVISWQNNLGNDAENQTFASADDVQLALSGLLKHTTTFATMQRLLQLSQPENGKVFFGKRSIPVELLKEALRGIVKPCYLGVKSFTLVLKPYELVYSQPKATLTLETPTSDWWMLFG